MAIQQLEQTEIELVSGAGLLTAYAVALGINPEGLFAGGGGTGGFGGAARGVFTQLTLLNLGALLIAGEALL